MFMPPIYKNAKDFNHVEGIKNLLDFKYLKIKHYKSLAFLCLV